MPLTVRSLGGRHNKKGPQSHKQSRKTEAPTCPVGLNRSRSCSRMGPGPWAFRTSAFRGCQEERVTRGCLGAAESRQPCWASRWLRNALEVRAASWRGQRLNKAPVEISDASVTICLGFSYSSPCFLFVENVEKMKRSSLRQCVSRASEGGAMFEMCSCSILSTTKDGLQIQRAGSDTEHRSSTWSHSHSCSSAGDICSA